MAMTRANAEFVLIARCCAMLTAAGMDGTTVDGTNADLNDPLVHSLRTCMAVAVGDVTNITDGAIAYVTYCYEQMFLDFATLYTFEAIWYHLTTVDISVGPRSEKLDQMAKRVEKIVERLHVRFEKDYAYYLQAPADVGYIQKDIAEHG